MLVLTRKSNERFKIGPDIQITVVRVDRKFVRIGIQAPHGTSIYREEILPIVPPVCSSAMADVESSGAKTLC